MKKILIADDNDFYFEIMREIYETLGFLVFRVCSAKEGWSLIQRKGIHYFDLINIDITMETQLSGLIMALKLRAKGYKNGLYLVSTGFNIRLNFWCSKMLLRLCGIERVIPKNLFHQASRKTLTQWLI